MSQPHRQSDYSPSEKDGYGEIPPGDPYRVAVRNGTAPEMAQGNNVMGMQTGSQRNAAHMSMPTYDHYDPYGVPSREPASPTEGQPHQPYQYQQQQQQQQAFLPYGNQRADPFATIPSAGSEPGNLVDDKEGNDSLLRDNHNHNNNMIAMDMMHDDFNNVNSGCNMGSNNNDQLSASEILTKQKRRCCSGPRSRGMVFAAFVVIILVALATFFVWPRWPNSILFQSLDIITPYDASDPNSKIYEAVWRLNLTVDNSDNWISTRMNGFTVKVADGNTHVNIGRGQTSAFTLPGKSRDILVSLPLTIQYSTTNGADTTLNDLFYCASVASESSSITSNKAMNLIFYVREEISGLVWSETATVHPNIVGCPT